ncbi:MAG: GH3 auxin-responsive promoter family protein [Cytophagaceae bacterium]|nr:GH3 auxin-responsive promoter family protein [Cytophagaceae bacterium]MBL0327043.1 GH3 auxin-responsive promoter family protein [Cytophagaceae bacterium]
MDFTGITIKTGLKIANIIKSKKIRTIHKQQEIALRKLLKKAQDTEFGRYYDFKKILKRKNKNKLLLNFNQTIPVHTYETMYNNWWFKTRNGNSDITWPGKVKYFALSSGTSEAASKAIPVTKEMIKSIHKTSINQVISLANFTSIPASSFTKGYLLFGGSTQLNRCDDHFEGDLSGITSGKIPFWFENFYKPGKKISSERDWENKLDKIVEMAPHWDISFVAGVPAWILLLFERIISHYKVNNIQEIWPNLISFGWGGVSIEPYLDSFKKLLNPEKPFHFIETYLASEGFIAYQNKPKESLKLVTNGGIYFEFVEFNDDNFDEEGNILFDAKALTLKDVEPNKNYALLLTTCSGAWRYLIGDTIKFMDTQEALIQITGRTKHFLSVCGEHLSVENLNKAIKLLSVESNIEIKEFGVMSFKTQKSFGHHWFIGSDSTVIEPETVGTQIDNFLKILNDDYAVERNHALDEIKVSILPNNHFIDWMKANNKMGGQNKFPRVLKGKTKDNWLEFLESQKQLQA